MEHAAIWCLFPCLFQQGNAKPHSARVTSAWLCSKRVWVIDWPACSPVLSQIDGESKNGDCSQTAEQLKSYMKQEWERILTTKLQQLVSVPRRLLSVVRWRSTVVNIPLPTTLLDCVAGINFKTSDYLQKTIKFISLNIKYFVCVVHSIEYLFANNCSLFSFTFYTTSQLHWNWGLYDWE